LQGVLFPKKVKIVVAKFFDIPWQATQPCYLQHSLIVTPTSVQHSLIVTPMSVQHSLIVTNLFATIFTGNIVDI
jgi:hypothetical protein